MIRLALAITEVPALCYPEMYIFGVVGTNQGVRLLPLSANDAASQSDGKEHFSLLLTLKSNEQVHLMRTLVGRLSAKIMEV